MSLRCALLLFLKALLTEVCFKAMGGDEGDHLVNNPMLAPGGRGVLPSLITFKKAARKSRPASAPSK